MVDRILHIGHKFSNEYNKELLQRAAEVYIKKGHAGMIPHLTEKENLSTAEAGTLAQKINREMVKVNREVLLYYGVILALFLVIAVFSLRSQSYIFAALFLLPALRILYSMLKFIRKNTLK